MKLKSVLMGCVLTCAVGVFADAPAPEKLLPGDTLAVLTVPEYAKAKETFKKSCGSQLWNDAALKPFRDKFTGKLSSDVITPLEKEFGIKLSDYSGLAQGQITLALTPNGPKGKDGEPEPGFVLLVDSRGQSARLQTNLAALKNKWVDSGKQVRTEKIRDVEFTTLIFNSDDVSKVLEKVFPNPPERDAAVPDKEVRQLEWLIGQSGSLFVLGNSAKDIERILVNQGGGSAGTLADQGNFASGFNSQFRDSQGYGWVNLKTIFDNLSKAGDKNEGGGRGPMGMSSAKMMSALGLSGLNSLGFSLRENDDGTLLQFALNAPESGRRGLLKLLSFEAKDASPPPFVPGDAVKFSRWRLDLPKTWETLENTITEAMPQMANVLKLVLDSAGKDKDPNFDLRKNLIQNLGDDIISFQKTPRQQNLAGLNSPPSLTLISSPRPDQLAASVRALTALMPQQASKYKEREFLGRKVYAISLPPTMAGGKQVEQTLHYSASGGYVALSTDIAMLEEYLRSAEGSGKSLRDTTGLNASAEKVGGMSTGFFTYENQLETTRTTLETLKKESGTLATLFSASPLAGRLGMGENSDKLKDWVDFSLLPPYDQISKYFHHTVTAGGMNPQGLNIRMFTPRPPQLKK